MKIGEAARAVGVDVHVLRHWNDVGVVVPERTASGHRVYTEEHLARLRIVRACQSAGMSLPEVRLILHRDEAGRDAVIASRIAWIRAQRARLEAAERFLSHVVDCRHDLVTRCDECAEYAEESPVSGPRPQPTEWNP